MLYHLANNKEVQEILFNETKKILPNADDAISPVFLNNEATYARAVLKESMRLNPISVGVGRNLNKDTVLSGYLIPKGVIPKIFLYYKFLFKKVKIYLFLKFRR